MKHPCLAVALCYASGILLGDWLPFSWGALLVAAAGMAAAALAWPTARPWLLGPMLVLAGAANFTRQTAVLSPCDLRVLAGEQAQLAAVRGRLSETPYQRVYEHRDQTTWRTLARVEVESVRLGKAEWGPAAGSLLVTTPGVLPGNFCGGQRVEISGAIQPPPGPAAEGLFDYRAYLRRQGIYYQLRVASTNDWRAPAPAAAAPWADRFTAWAHAMLARGLPAEDEPLRLLWAMTLGWKTALTSEVSEPFMRSGTMHIFAISGLHIALIAGICVKLLTGLRVPRGWCGLIVIPLIWAYTYVTGMQASAIRSAIMSTVMILGWSWKRPSNILNSLFAAGLIILVWDPQQLFQAGFQLSFLVVLSLAVVGTRLNELARRLLAPDPYLPESLRPRWQQALRRPTRHLTVSFTTSLAACVGSIPLIAYYFHLFTPVSLLANMIVVPLSGLALASNLASLAVGAWWPAAAELFNHSAWLWMQWMIWVSEWAARLPGGVYYVAAPGTLLFALYYGALAGLLTGGRLEPRARRWAVAGLGLAAAAWLWSWGRAQAETRLTILPLRGSHALYLCGPATQGDWLIDCGDESAARWITKPFLQARGVNRLAHLCLTHGDQRHVGGVELLRQSFAVRQAHISGVRFRSPAYRQTQRQFQDTPGLLRPLGARDRAGPWTVLHPADDKPFPQADDNALVLHGELGGTRVLLLSDLGKPGQNRLLERYPDLRADIVITGFPVQGEPLADALLEIVKPRLVILAEPEPLREPLRARLARHHVRVLHARDTGAITLNFQRAGWELTTVQQPEAWSE